MDTTAKEITFNEEGVCNFCLQAQKALREIEVERPNLPKIINQIKKDGGKVLLGLSGGVDSSITLHNAIQLGLKPICFSLDNKWNTKEADSNVKNLVDKTGVKWIKYEIDFEKYTDLQSAFIKAGLPNIEIPTDHILMAATYETAAKHGIKWILSGGNTATESIMPRSWGYQARDLTHIKDVYRRIKGKKLTGLPVCGLLKWNYYRWIKGIKIVNLPDYFEYNREKAIKLLKKEYDYKTYGEKHCESTWTWWFQNYYLFNKFGIDKRKAHLSSLINSGQMTRKEALQELQKSPVYPKLGIEEAVMKWPRHDHYEFKTDEWLFNLISKVVRYVKKLAM